MKKIIYEFQERRDGERCLIYDDGTYVYTNWEKDKISLWEIRQEMLYFRHQDNPYQGWTEWSNVREGKAAAAKIKENMDVITEEYLLT